MPTPPWLSSGRIPSLDGLRAIAVLSVTLAHLVVAPGSPFPESWAVLKRLGPSGVNVFFVISGFLITHLLLRELEKTGRISLGAFWKRRALRILPAYLFLVATAFVLSRTGWYHVESDVWAKVLTYTLNLFPERLDRGLGHCWSLCVEEHFYLLWPLLLVLLGRRAAPLFLVLTVAATPVLRYTLFHTPGAPDVDYFTLTRLDTISFGCLLAYFVRTPVVERLRTRVERRASLVAVISAAVFGVSVFVLARSGKYVLLPKAALDALAVCAFLFAVTASERGAVGRVLNWRPLAAVGVLSYSLYLGQLFANATLAPGWPLSWWWNLPCVVAYALVSHFLIERPFLRLKGRSPGGPGDPQPATGRPGAQVSEHLTGSRTGVGDQIPA